MPSQHDYHSSINIPLPIVARASRVTNSGLSPDQPLAVIFFVAMATFRSTPGSHPKAPPATRPEGDDPRRASAHLSLYGPSGGRGSRRSRTPRLGRSGHHRRQSSRERPPRDTAAPVAALANTTPSTPPSDPRDFYNHLLACSSSEPMDSDVHVSVLRDWISAVPAASNLQQDVIEDASARLVELGVSLHDLGDYSRDEFLGKCAGEPAAHRHPGRTSLADPGALRRALLAAVDLASSLERPAVVHPAAPHAPGTPEVGSGAPRTDPSGGGAERVGGLDLRTPSPPRRDDGPPANPYRQDRLVYAVSRLLDKTRRNAHHTSPYEEEDLDLDGPERYDIASFKKQRLDGDCSVIDVNSFCDSAKLARVARNCEEARARRPYGPYVHPSGFESWQPAWLGSGLPTPERREFVLARSKVAPTSSAALVNSLAAYWLSHAALGQVSVQTVLAHILLVCRLCDQHSLHFAVKYLSRLSAHTHSRIANGESVDLDHTLTEVDIDVLRLTHFEQERARVRDRAPAAPPVGVPPKEKGKGRGKRDPPPSGSGGGEAPPSRPRHICFLHDPANNLTCSKGSACGAEHLDTRQEPLKQRFVRAKASFDKRKGKISKAAH